MKTKEIKVSEKWTYIFPILLFLLIAIVIYLNMGRTAPQMKSDSQLAQITTSTLQVKAKKGRFYPREIEIKHGEKLNLEIEAVDRDYAFNLPEFNIQETIKKGSIRKVTLEGLGVGEYRYSCGDGCQGEVEVEAKSDDED